MTHAPHPRLLIVAALNLVCAFAAEPFDFGPWPAGTSPQEIGKRVAENFVIRPHASSNRSAPKYITNPETCTWYGALTFAQLTHDEDLSHRLVARFEPLFTPAEANFMPMPIHVDYSIFGVVPLEIYIQTRDTRCLKTGQRFADAQWEKPADPAKIDPLILPWIEKGLTPQTRFWIDDMYMITVLQVQAWRATKDPVYLDRAALEMSVYLDQMQKPNGLFFHAPDVPFFWGRGNGWVAAGMAEFLRDLPASHPRHAQIFTAYHKMMAGLLKYQGEDGMWRQLIDRPESWPETSSTAMFTFAFITGVKNGWLDAATYGPAARKAWIALAAYLDDNANIREVCEGTGKKNDYDYYMRRKRVIGELHGQAPLLWCASALLR